MIVSKRPHEMDVAELEQFIREQAKRVERLEYERRGTAEYRHEGGILKDVKQLLDEKRRQAGRG